MGLHPIQWFTKLKKKKKSSLCKSTTNVRVNLLENSLVPVNSIEGKRKSLSEGSQLRALTTYCIHYIIKFVQINPYMDT